MTIEIECETKKWGSSIGIIIPKNVIIKEQIDAGQKIIVEIKRMPKVGDIFGDLSTWSRSTDEIKKEMKEGWK